MSRVFRSLSRVFDIFSGHLFLGELSILPPRLLLFVSRLRLLALTLIILLGLAHFLRRRLDRDDLFHLGLKGSIDVVVGWVASFSSPYLLLNSLMLFKRNAIEQHLLLFFLLLVLRNYYDLVLIHLLLRLAGLRLQPDVVYVEILNLRLAIFLFQFLSCLIHLVKASLNPNTTFIGGLRFRIQ